jgi:hypothetical protein
MWRCFICASDRACEHRERDLLLWYAKLFRDERPNAVSQIAAVEPIERKPPARATEAAEAPAERARAAGGGD